MIMNLKSNLFKSCLYLTLLPLVSSSAVYSETNNKNPSKSKNYIAQVQGTNIPFEVCFNSDTWTRPSPIEQANAYKRSSRYSYHNITPQDVVNNPLWTVNLIPWSSSGSIGALLMSDYRIHSGLWTVRDDNNSAFDCADKVNNFRSNPSAKSTTKIVLWVISHKVKAVKWQNSGFTLVVEPSNTGFQEIIFDKRKPHPETLTFNVVDTKGRFLAKCNDSCSFK